MNTENTTSYSEYLPKHERPIITALLTAVLARDKTITINDGEEDIITSNKLPNLRAALAGTGEDYLCFEGGYFHLVYDNGSRDNPMVVVSDYSDNPLCDDLYNDLTLKYGE